MKQTLQLCSALSHGPKFLAEIPFGDVTKAGLDYINSMVMMIYISIGQKPWYMERVPIQEKKIIQFFIICFIIIGSGQFEFGSL